MRPPGAFKLFGRARRNPLGAMDPLALGADRSHRIVDSLRTQILESDVDQQLRIRRIFENPREIYRIEIERPDQGYQRTTLLDRDALEDLLATDDVRERLLEPVPTLDSDGASAAYDDGSFDDESDPDAEATAFDEAVSFEGAPAAD